MDFVSLLTFKLVFGMPETSLFIGFFSHELKYGK